MFLLLAFLILDEWVNAAAVQFTNDSANIFELYSIFLMISMLSKIPSLRILLRD